MSRVNNALVLISINYRNRLLVSFYYIIKCQSSKTKLCYVLINTSSDSKKVAFIFFGAESLSNQGKSISKTKSWGKIGFEFFPYFKVSFKH
jgi:hypothetical protein